MENAKFVLSKSIVLRQYAKVKDHADIVSYSSKTNPVVTRILEENTGSMFSIHLVNELRHVKDKSRVIFLAQAWDRALVNYLISSGIRWFVADNEADLEVLIEYLENCAHKEQDSDNGSLSPDLGVCNDPTGTINYSNDYSSIKINLLLRLKLKELTLRTEKFFVFGMDSGTIARRIREICENKDLKSKIGHLGIHFHRKTQNMSEWNLKDELHQVLAPVLGHIDVINIGGGIPSEYANTNVAVINSVFSRIDELKEFFMEKGIKLMIEPGRFIAAPSGKLHTKIDAIYGNNIIVNASVYNSDMDALIVPVKLLVEGELKNGEGMPYVIKGCTPCSMDLFRYRVYLDKPKVGDKIVFLNAGAYNLATDFCDLEKPETEVVD